MKTLSALAVAIFLSFQAGSAWSKGAEALSTQAGILMNQAASSARSLAAQDQNGIGDALAVLYKRLFDLEDKKREAELSYKKYDSDLDFKVILYKRDFDRYATKESLVKLAFDPEHRDYPGPTQSIARNAIEAIRVIATEMRQLSAGMTILDAQTAQTDKRIQDLLARLGRAG